MYLYYLIIVKVITAALGFKVKTEQMKDFNISLITQSCGFLPTMGCILAETLETQTTVQDHAI